MRETVPGGGGPEREHVPKGRLLALTDGVVAIAMTILVLDVRLPARLDGRELDDALGHVAAQVWTFLISAVVIAVFWRAHHAALRRAERIDPALFWLNIAFLILLSLIPFPTSVLEDYSDKPLGPGLYGAVIGLAALALYLMEVRVERRTAADERRRVPLPAQAAVFLGSIGIALVAPTAALYSWLASIPLSHLANRRAYRSRR
ncbi:TMEM175 family protein [Streptomyces sp. TR06-5]|uniref:TMEM175 family protein n=1 Tax=unclassified Streptomyces TaxID=2593676 RepID=UPI0039A35B4D